jgi:aspartyl-tRNA(Asn)/glutamyl-tRNA(Gln) amidotransferase subunit C
VSISRAEVEKVALLARLELSAAEIELLTTQMGEVLDYMNLLGEVNTDNVEPMAHALDLCDVFRDDTVRPGLERAAALQNAPRADGQCYLVPAVLE